MTESIERVWRRVLMLIGRGRITLVDDAGAAQLVQVRVSGLEVKDDAPRLAEYGFQSVPPVGSDALVVFMAGDRSSGVVVATGNQQFRMRALATGEVAISDDKGQHVYLSAAGIRIVGGGLPIEITNAPSVLIDSPAVHMTGALQVDGNVTSGANITAVGNVGDQGGAKTMAGMRAVFNPHTHSDPQGGSVSGPSATM